MPQRACWHDKSCCPVAVFKHNTPSEDESYFKGKRHRMADVCNKVRSRVLEHLDAVCQPAMFQLAFIASVAAPCQKCRKCSKHKNMDCKEKPCAELMPKCKWHSVRLCCDERCAKDVCAQLCELKKSAPRTGTPCSKCKRPCRLPRNARCWISPEVSYDVSILIVGLLWLFLEH